MASLLVGGCDSEPEPSASWAPGRIMPRSTVKSKQIIRVDPNDPSSAVTCYEVVLEWSARTDRYCVTARLWEKAEPNKIMSWE
jgi:hypothetical protein